jgi:hypothetical protein
MEDVVPPRLTEGGLVVSSPLASLTNDTLRMIKVENVAVGTRTERTLADVTGPGSVKSLTEPACTTGDSLCWCILHDQ